MIMSIPGLEPSKINEEVSITKAMSIVNLNDFTNINGRFFLSLMFMSH